MAKPRKSKNEEQKPESSVVLHQKLCLSIDMEKRKIYGHTELKISVPDGGYVAMHADNILISNITVDGEPADFEHFSHYQPVDDETKWSSVSCVKTAADAASSTYLLSLNKEADPNLLISCHNLKKPLNDQNQEDTRIVEQNSSVDQVVNGYSHPEDKTQNVKLVRINYLVDKAETGIHFGGNVLHTNNQIRRACCWFPCVDNISERCPFDMEFTVNSNYVAVSNGNLLYQVLSKDDPPRRTYVYNVSVPVSAGWISLAVAPFEILPDSHTSIVSHMCMAPYNSKLQNTVGFFHSAFSHYEDYLSAAFPFGSYKQIFIPPELSISSMSLGASMCIFSSQLLYDEKIIDQVVFILNRPNILVFDDHRPEHLRKNGMLVFLPKHFSAAGPNVQLQNCEIMESDFSLFIAKTIETRIKLAYALARQWFGIYITAEDPMDEWLVDGLAGFLADSFIKRFLGNNEARYRLYKANCAVCKVDISGATALSSVAASTDLYGTQSIGLYGKIRSWKAVAVLQMLEKQMGPDSFRKILQNIVNKAADTTRSRTLTTKEFNNLAYKVGNLERPFLKEFFPSWVESCGCPVLRMGLSYNKRKNMIELAVMRGCTAKSSSISNSNPESGTREGDAGWPGMMSIRVHELDGMYDHPSLPMAGDTWQLLEIQCHSKLAAKRIQKSKKGSKPDGSDDNAEITPTLDMRTSMDTPLLWIRVDPEMEYLAEIHFHQPVQMWINQLEKDKDVVAQAQAIATLEKLPQLSFSVVNALNNFLTDSKAFWRVRIEAAYALAHTASEDTDWAGLLHLIKFYKSRRFDPDIGLPRPNDFHDVPEYFVLEAIPHAVSLIRAADQKSPREAVEFVLQLLKYNDNNGNPYSDVFWLSALVQSIGELEFNQQTVSFLSSLLKRIDRLLQFDSLMPSYNGMLTISCIRTLAQIALKLSSSLPLEHVSNLIKPFQSSEKVSWPVRIEASKVLLDLEFYCKSLDAALVLFLRFLEEETSLRGETKLAAHMMHLCQENAEDSEHDNFVSCPTLIALLKMLASRKAFNNVCLRHHLYCILQIVAERPPTLYGVPKVQLQPVATVEPFSEQAKPASSLKLRIPRPQEPPPADTPNLSLEISALPVAELAREADTISNCSERRKNILKIKVKQPGSSSKVDDADHLMENSRCSQNEAPEIGPASSVSVDAPSQRYAYEAPIASNQNIEEVNSCHNQESHMSASIGSSAKLNKEDGARDLQCTADSVKIIHGDHPSPAIRRNNDEMVIHLQDRSLGLYDGDPGAPVSMVSDEEAREKRKKNKKDKEKKRKREEKSWEKDRSNDPDYLERKRQKKEKKRMEKELAKMKQQGDGKASGNSAHAVVVERSKGISSFGESKKSEGSTEQRSVSVVGETNSAPKLKIKIKGLGRGIR